jgi:hypothetical protein
MSKGVKPILEVLEIKLEGLNFKNEDFRTFRN